MITNNKSPESRDRRTFVKAAGAAAWCSSFGLLDVSRAFANSERVSRKKGFCTVAREHGDWNDRIQKLQAKWFYTCNSGKPEGVPDDVEFAPMIWGKKWMIDFMRGVEDSLIDTHGFRPSKTTAP